MNWNVYLLQCVVMLAMFSCLVFGMLLVNPLTFVSDYPPEVQERYYTSQHKEKQKEALTKIMIVKKVVAITFALFLFAYLAYKANARTYFEALLAIYGYIVVITIFDTCFLDWVLFANMKRVRLPGTENMDKEYHQKWFHVKACFPMVPVFIVFGLIAAGLTITLW